MIRILIASGLAILFVSGVTSQPVEARGGSFRTGSFHHPAAPTVRIVGRSTPAHASFDRHYVGQAFGQGLRDEPASRRLAFSRHGTFGWGLPFGYGYSGSYYGPSDGAGPDVSGDQDAAGIDPPYQVMAVVGPRGHAHDCRSQAQWVPGTHGLTRVVVTRC